MADDYVPGPIETLWQNLRAGEIGRERALALAASRATTAQLSPAYVNVLVEAAERLVWKDWAGAVALHELTLAAVDALAPGPKAASMQRTARLAWIEIVTRAVAEVPDGRLFRNAVAVGEKLVAGAQAEHDTETEADALHRLGILYLDPYRGGRSSVDYESQMLLWRQKLHDHFGDTLLGIPPEQLHVPEPAEALDSAASYLGRAADLRTGVGKALSLKPLGEALEWRGVLNLPVDSAAVARCYREAIALLDPARWPNECASVMAGMKRQGEPLPERHLATLLAISLPEYARAFGLPRAVDLGMQLLGLIPEAESERALVTTQHIEALLGARSEQARDDLYRRQVGLLVKTGAGTPGADWLDHARMSPQVNEELQGLDWLARVEATDPRLRQQFSGAMLWLRAALHYGAAVNALDAGDADGAAREDFEALRGYLQLRFDSHAMVCLRRLAGLAERKDPDVTVRLAAALADVSLRCQAVLGEPAVRIILHTCRELMKRIAEQGTVKPILALLVLNVAKGLRFAAAATAGARYDWASDPEGVALLEKVAEAEARVTRDPAEEGDARLNDTLVLAAYIAPGERGTGDQARDLLDNRQRSYDEHVNQRILEGAAGSLDLFPAPEVVQSALDDRTVLVNYYLGASPQGGIAVYMLALTKGEEWMTIGSSNDFPSGYTKLSSGGREVIVTPLGMLIQELLTSVAASPWEANVDSGAANLLESLAGTFLGNLRQYLERQGSAGKDHVCFVPHGPLHFFPLHLLGPPDKPLADDWIVTYLPNLRLLTRPKPPSPAGRGKQRAAVASIGVSFAEPSQEDHAAIPQAAREARAIAQLFDVKPLVDKAATEKAVLAALQASRYVHIATHGEHCLPAPAFQKLYVTPDDHSDGRICAYEILALDLRGLECITMSACETSLGRFDEADDLRGLPASFFIAGASTVVGALWRVETLAAQHFFTGFYKQVKKGARRLDAFGGAQRATRKKFPKYRDWGAFYLAGDWR